MKGPLRSLLLGVLLLTAFGCGSSVPFPEVTDRLRIACGDFVEEQQGSSQDAAIASLYAAVEVDRDAGFSRQLEYQYIIATCREYDEAEEAACMRCGSVVIDAVYDN